MISIRLDASRRTEVRTALVLSYTLSMLGIDYFDQHNYKLYMTERPLVQKQIEVLVGW